MKNIFILLLVILLAGTAKALPAGLPVKIPASAMRAIPLPLPRAQAGPASPHIASIVADTIKVVTGSTVAYTVDTKADEGLVSTATTVAHLLAELQTNVAVQRRQVTTADGNPKDTGVIQAGDRLILTNPRGSTIYYLLPEQRALTGKLELLRPVVTAQVKNTITLHYTAGQRSPDATVTIHFPAGITITPENTTVNVIGRGAVLLRDLPGQSIGRTGTRYSYKRVGEAVIEKAADGSTTLTLRHLDLRPANGPDLVLVIQDVMLNDSGRYFINATSTTSQPAVLASSGLAGETADLWVTNTIADFKRVVVKDKPYHELPHDYTQVQFRWTPVTAGKVTMEYSTDTGRHWSAAKASIDAAHGTAFITGLRRDKLYHFRLLVKDGVHRGSSNIAGDYTGMLDVRMFGVHGNDTADHTAGINEAIRFMHNIGGGTLLFSEGVYNVRTVHLLSNVYLYISKEAVIRAGKGADAPETTWFSDRAYRSGLSPTDRGPYEDPENYLTKQDVGHHYFHNAMFFGERLDNIKIIGNGRITGNGHLVTSDKVMNNAPDKRADKMFSLKLCTNVEIGGLHRDHDLWYDSVKDVPYYVDKGGLPSYDDSNMLQIDRAGHFVLLATGTDTLFVHDTYFGKMDQANVRDIYDFMACNQVTVRNIYSRVSSDDIVKPGSDCSLGFTRPARHYRVRNVIGDTNCNLFQIGSETADDIMDICVDNIYVLGANKAGFSISTNDGGRVKDIHLNCGHTGPVNQRSRMMRTTAPFFISISNRGRVLGATVGQYTFVEEGRKRTELLVQNVNIGQVENIVINSIDISEVYGGSSFGNGSRWKPFDGSQHRATSIIAGYALPAAGAVEGGLDFTLPDGRHTGYIRNVVFNDVHITDKGGHPLADTAQRPPELGVGQYNVSNLKVQPSYGLWARHVEGLTISESSFRFEQPDSRYALFLDDVQGAALFGIKTVRAAGDSEWLRYIRSSGVRWKNILFYQEAWGKSPVSAGSR
ncbi:Polygalacturonase [Chitinophaga eiseniae]|uniref:Polygalacturonase n=1 Tax=Chitinophaga eiseniae TaxID=634771 RepID=A0A1T4M2A9_9BACT|nr:endopygalactorunase [Chitinophaga eiseniae]SJZ61026.1 Polygalacturonase [Chitinophaga eiseniae]